MHVTITHQGDRKFQVSGRQHTIVSDQPLTSNGQGNGMTPSEWFLAALGSCVGDCAVQYLHARGIETTALQVEVVAQKVPHPTRLDELDIHLSLSIALDEQYYEGLEDAIEACILHNTLTHPPQITTRITAGMLAAVL